VKFQWTGVAEYQRMLQAVSQVFDDTSPELKQVLMVPAKAMAANASALAAKKTGLLASSIYASNGGAKQRGVIIRVNKKAWYARFVEFGTRYMPPRPFFRPAFLQMYSSYINDISPGLKKLVEDTATKNAYHAPG
jgi:HK97 gp10 family phage protein